MFLFMVILIPILTLIFTMSLKVLKRELLTTFTVYTIQFNISNHLLI